MSKGTFAHEREIWWCSLGTNVGSEEDGTGRNYDRPVLILKGVSKETCFVIPLTTSVKIHRLRPSVGTVAGKSSHALLSQLRLIDTRRLVRKIGVLQKDIFEQVRKNAKDML